MSQKFNLPQVLADGDVVGVTEQSSVGSEKEATKPKQEEKLI